jgi:hypothetical protein
MMLLRGRFQPSQLLYEDVHDVLTLLWFVGDVDRRPRGHQETCVGLEAGCDAAEGVAPASLAVVFPGVEVGLAACGVRCEG